MIKHFCDMCGDEIHDAKIANIKNYSPLVEIKVELCDTCHAKLVNQLFPRLGEKISEINARIPKRKAAKKAKVAAPDSIDDSDMLFDEFDEFDESEVQP